jgi:hypothetical protein
MIFLFIDSLKGEILKYYPNLGKGNERFEFSLKNLKGDSKNRHE